MTSDPLASNQLANASSPYLRQHAANPVHWQQWAPATLTRAREQDTPILLSIGYAACHWCHVMAHECFENADIAAQMNTNFINIKLDREQRPDIDHIYQLAFQAFNGRGGGWPLTAFLDPADLTPFFIATYIPPTPAHGMPGFGDVLRQLRSHYDEHRSELNQQGAQLRQWLQQVQAAAGTAPPALDSAQRTALQRVADNFDAQWGGDQGAPKFPRAVELEWLLDNRHQRPEAGAMATHTLVMMASRGLQDHLGGGFFRYCVDHDWTIPHFEKMLYDNAQLLAPLARLASEPSADTDTRTMAEAATRGIVAWLEREMQSEQGAFYSSLDADSEGEEGKFYLWTREQLQAGVGEDDVALAQHAFGLDAAPNFEGRAWHLLRAQPLAKLAEDSGETFQTRYAGICDALLKARARRPRPGCDDKLLTAWNALTISGLARAARMLDDEHFARLAQRALAAVREAAWIDGQLYANLAKADDRIPGFLDDYAFLLDALLEVLQLEFDVDMLNWASALADGLLAQFRDEDSGGFWFSSHEHATPLARGRNLQDASLPSGNAVAAQALLRLGHLLGETRYLQAAEAALASAGQLLEAHPEAALSHLRALAEQEQPRAQIVVRCSAEQQQAWRDTINTQLRARGLTPGGDAIDVFIINDHSAKLPGVLANRNNNSQSGTAWLCAGLACQAPVTTAAALESTLQAAAIGADAAS